jgi:hypothetical protein
VAPPEPPERLRAHPETVGEDDRAQRARRKRAARAFEQGHVDDADRLVEEALAADRDDVRAWYLAARVAGRGTDVGRTAARLRGLLEAAERTGQDPGGALGERLQELSALRDTMADLELPAPLLGTPVVVVENGVHPLAVTGLLDRMRPLRVLGERRIEGLRFAGGVVEPLRDLTEGGPEEQALAEVARARGDAITEALRRAVRAGVGRRGDVDLVEAQRFDLVSRQLSHLLVERACTAAVDPSRASGVLVLAGNGRNAALMAAVAARRLGSERVFTLDGRLGTSPADRAFAPHRPDEEAPELGRPPPSSRWRSTALGLGAAARRVVGRPAPAYAADGRAVVLTWAVHEPTMLPVVRELATDGPVSVLVVGNRRALAPYRRLAREGLPVVANPVGAVSDATSEGAAAAVADRRVRRAAAADGPLTAASVRDAEWVVGRTAMLARFAGELRDAFTTDATSVLLLARDRGAHERVAVMVARELGVPSLTVQPVLMSASPIYNPLHADHTTAFDHHARQLYVDHLGARPEAVSVTGFARFSPRPAGGTGPEDAATRGRTVLLAMQMFSLEDAERLLLAVATARGPGTELLVKLHPREPATRVDHYREVLAGAGAGSGAALVTETPMTEVLPRATVVVSSWSNTLLEAAMDGRPALSVNLTGGPLPVPVGELGIAYEARSEEEVHQVLPQLLEDTPLRAEVLERQRRYLAANPHLLDEVPAARRIADVAGELARRGAARRAR